MPAKANQHRKAAAGRPAPVGDGSGGRQRLSDIQRGRMLTAMAEAAAELGARNVRVADVVSRSGVSRRTFYEHFADRAECFIAAFDLAMERMTARVVPAYERHERWRDGIRAALGALLAFLDEEPHLGRLLFVQALGAGQAVLDRRQQAVAAAVKAVAGGAQESRSGDIPPLTAEGVAGAVFSIVHSRLLDDRRPPLVELTSELVSVIVLPYVGAAAARRELARPTPEPRPSAAAGLSVLRELDMRLTYRTVRVLMAIGAQPGASNREVAVGAEIQDQGQVSKLLRRLVELDLIRNTSEQRVKGEANSWLLTDRGARVRSAISAQATSLP